MKDTFKSVLFGKSAVITASLAIGLLMIVGLGCGGGSKSVDEKQAGPEYVGSWSASDGSTITIRSDGSADYKIGGSSVSGGKALVSEKDKTLRVSLLGMGSPMKVDKAPENGQMTIDGIVYKKGGGGSTGTTESKPSPSATKDDDDH